MNKKFKANNTKNLKNVKFPPLGSSIWMFLEDFSNLYSLNTKGELFSINSSNEKFKELLLGDYGDVNYNLDRLFGSTIKNLFLNGKAYIKIVFNEENKELVNINFYNIPYRKTIKGIRYIKFYGNHHDGSKTTFKIKKHYLIEFNLKDFGISLSRFKKQTRILERGKLPDVEVILNNKNNVDMNHFNAKKDFYEVMGTRETFWNARNSSNSLVNDCYLLYRYASYNQIKFKALCCFVDKINEKLMMFKDVIGCEGTIELSNDITDFSQCIDDLQHGVKNITETSNKLFR